MENNGRTRGILVFLIVVACGALSLIVRALEPAQSTPAPEPESILSTPTAALSPTATSVTAFTPSPAPTYTLAPTYTPVPTSTLPPTPTPTTTHTAVPTNAPLPTETPAPTETPTSTPLPPPTAPPRPTDTPTPVPPLEMDWVLVDKHCISAAQWFLEFWLTAKGGTGEYTFYRDIERLHGPAPVHGFGYQMYAGTGSAVVGTFIVESGAQRVRSEFWIERLDCSDLAPPPTPPDPPTPGAAVSPLDPPSPP